MKMFVLGRLIKPSNKGWLLAKQLLCLDKRKGKTESPQYFSINSLNLMFSFSYLCSQSISLCFVFSPQMYIFQIIVLKPFCYFDTWGVPPPQGTIWKFSSIHHKLFQQKKIMGRVGTSFFWHSRVQGGTGLLDQRYRNWISPQMCATMINQSFNFNSCVRESEL